MDAKQPGKGVYRVEYEAAEDEAGNAATELATFKQLPGNAQPGAQQPVLREMSPLASTASGQAPQVAPPVPAAGAPFNQTLPTNEPPRGMPLQRTLAMPSAPMPNMIPAAQPRRADPVPYLQSPSQASMQPQMPQSRQMMPPSQLPQQPLPQQGPPPGPQMMQPQAPPQQQQAPMAGRVEDPVTSVAGVPSPMRGWIAFVGVLVIFVALAIVLYSFLFRG
jgi:hypothetical protein